MTPFQRQVIDSARIKEAEAQREQHEEMSPGGNTESPPRNARAGGGQSTGSRSETVRYINKRENPDHAVHQD